MLFRLNAFNITGTTGWTNFKMTATGTIASNIVDQSTGSPTDVNLSYTGTLWSATASTGLIESIDYHGVPASVWRNWNNTAIANAGTLTMSGASIAIGSQWVIGFAGAVAATPSRNTTITANGVSQTYISGAQSVPIVPAKPVYLTTTAVDDGSGNGKIDFTFAGNLTNKYVTFITATNEPTIFNVNSDDAVKVGQTITWDAALITPTSATIGGVVLTDVTATGGTIPNIADGAVFPNFGGVDLILSDGVNTATRRVYLYPADGFGYTRIRDVSNNNDGYLKKYIADLTVDDVIYFPLGSSLDPAVTVNGIDFDGRVITDRDGTQTIYRRATSGGMVTAFALDTSSVAPPSPEGGLSVTGLTATGLTVRGLSVRGL